MDNIILIGMPAVGKSTVGVLLAKAVGYGFVDSDLVIQSREGRLLSRIIAEEGIDRFLEIEGKINAELCVDRCVIATGGSVIYNEKAMCHLKEMGRIVYLKISLEDLQRRLSDLRGRGVAIREGYTLKDLYDERAPLYEKYADVTAELDGKDISAALNEILEALVS